MLKVMDYINNHFIRSGEVQAFEITASSIKGAFREVYLPGMRLIIRGSYLNDGLHTITAVTDTEITVSEVLTPENTGKLMSVYASTPPADFIDLCTEIENHTETGIGTTSESIDDYSVSYAGDGSWQSVYKSKLNQYRRVYSDLDTSIKSNYRWQDRM